MCVMRRVTAIGLIGLAMVVLSARPASAQWEWFKWIQELSGPGPFELSGVSVTFGCTGSNPNRVLTEGPPVYRVLFCDRNPDSWRTVKRFWGVTVATGDGKNNLVFPAGIDSLERVSASVYLVRGMARVHPAVDVGSASGFMRFTARPGITVSKFVIDPVVAFRPFAAGMTRTSTHDAALDFFARSVELNAGVFIFPQGFRVTDFGATGGPDLTGDPEISFHVGLKFSIVF
jgi:hypothetical protein